MPCSPVWLAASLVDYSGWRSTQTLVLLCSQQIYSMKNWKTQHFFELSFSSSSIKSLRYFKTIQNLIVWVDLGVFLYFLNFYSTDLSTWRSLQFCKSLSLAAYLVSNDRPDGCSMVNVVEQKYFFLIQCEPTFLNFKTYSHQWYVFIIRINVGIINFFSEKWILQ